MTLADLKAQEKAAKKAEKERQKRIDADEKAERKRAAKTGFSNPANPTRSMALTIVCAIFAVYCLFPFVYLMINATKTQSDFTSTFGLGFGKTFALFDNIATVFSYQDGELRQIDAQRLSGTAQQAAGGETLLSTATVLIRFLAGINDGAVRVCTEIQDMTPGYQANLSRPVTYLSPVWRITTDTGVYYMDGVTGEITPAV